VWILVLKGQFVLNIVVNFQFSSDNLRIVWSQDIGTDINEETWKAVLNRVYSSSLCTSQTHTVQGGS